MRRCRQGRQAGETNGDDRGARLSTAEAILAASFLLSSCALPGAAVPASDRAGNAVAASPASGTATVAGSCLTAGVCAGGTPVAETAGVRKLQVSDLAPMLASKDFLLVNVHIPYEGEIAGTDALLPYNEIERNLDKLPADKGAKVVLYCRSGAMSAIAAGKLVELGYTNVWDVQGGMVAWEQAGFALSTKGR